MDGWRASTAYRWRYGGLKPQLVVVADVHRVLWSGRCFHTPYELRMHVHMRTGGIRKAKYDIGRPHAEGTGKKVT